jgi:hypothetical protein
MSDRWNDDVVSVPTDIATGPRPRLDELDASITLFLFRLLATRLPTKPSSLSCASPCASCPTDTLGFIFNWKP